MPSTRSLDPEFRPYADELLAVAKQLDPRFVVTSARRSLVEQVRLYARYLRGQNDGLPVAKPGTSNHELGLAVDIARPGIPPFQDELLGELGGLWVDAGGRWSPKDPVHFTVW